MFFKTSIILLIVFGVQVIRCQPPPDYDDDDCACPCDRDDADDPCWNNCDDDDYGNGNGCGAVLANLGLGGTLGNVGNTLDNTLGGLGRKKRQTDISLDDIVAIADVLSRKKRDLGRKKREMGRRIPDSSA